MIFRLVLSLFTLLGSELVCVSSAQISQPERELPQEVVDEWTSLFNETIRLHSAKQFHDAELVAVEALEFSESELGANHDGTNTSAYNLAVILKSQERYEEAEPLFLRALNGRKVNLGENRDATIKVMLALSDLYDLSGRSDEAIILLKRAWNGRAKSLGESHPDTVAAAAVLFEIYKRQNRVNDAQEVAARLLTAMESEFGNDAPETLMASLLFANVLYYAGEFEHAEPLYIRLLNAGEFKSGAENYRQAADMLESIAEQSLSDGRFAKAEELHRHALTAIEHIHGFDHPKTLQATNDLAFSVKSQGRFLEAEPMYQRTLEIQQRVLGSDHLDTLSSENNLATLYVAQGRYQDAEPLLIRVLESRERILGADHQDTLTSVNNLGYLYQAMGRYDDAEYLYLRAFRDSKNRLGPDDPDTLSSLNNLAALYVERGRYQDAKPLLERALESRERVLGADHLSTANTLSNLASLHKALGHHDQAEQLFLRVLRVNEQQLGSDHPDTFRSASNLGSTYVSQGRYGEAELVFRRVLSDRKRILGPVHPDTIVSSNNLASLHSRQGRHDEAEAMMRLIIRAFEGALDDEHPNTLTALDNLAGILSDQQNQKGAEAVHDRVFKARERALGSDHPDTLLSASNLASVYAEQGRLDEAEIVLADVIDTRERVLGMSHPDTLLSIGLLANVYEAQGRLDEAEQLYIRSILENAEMSGGSDVHRVTLLSNYATFLARDQRTLPAAIFHLKQAVNILQATRLNMSILDSGIQGAFLKEQLPVYQALQSHLIDAGRFGEAEQVGRLIKGQEFLEFVRQRSSQQNNIVAERLALTPIESQWSADLSSWSDRPNRIGIARASLRAKAANGVTLSSLETSQLRDLDSEYAEAYAAYKSRVDDWLASVRNISDETIQQEAYELEVRFHDDLQYEISQIGEDVAVLQIVAFEESLHFFLVTPHAFKHIEKPVARAELNEAIFEARRAILPDERTGRLNPNALKPLQALYSELMEPVATELEDAGTKTLMLNLHGAIRYIPFAALHDGERYMAQRFNLALFTPAARTRFEETGPLQEATGFGVTRRHNVDGVGTFLALPGVRSELEMLLGSESKRGIVDGVSLFDTEFTKTAFIEQLNQRRPLVHIASHFLMRPGNDPNSFLLMGDGSQLTLSEINNSVGVSFRGIELLTLSACSTALSTQGDFDVDSGTGAEFEGFGVLAQQKGADAVLASLWDVSDDSTSKLMASLYRGLSTGALNKAQALRAAQIQLISDPATEHPYYWAPFVLMGNWR